MAIKAARHLCRAAFAYYIFLSVCKRQAVVFCPLRGQNLHRQVCPLAEVGGSRGLPGPLRR